MKYVYTLSDPRSPGTIRYVGCTVNLAERLYSHMNNDAGPKLKCEWIKELKQNGLRPIMSLVEEVSDEKAVKREKYWMDYYQSEHLLNLRNPVEQEMKILVESILTGDEWPLTIAQLERRYIHMAVKRCNGNKVEAAKLLGIGRQTLYNKLEEYGLTHSQ